MDNVFRNALQAGTGDNVLPLCKVQQSLRCITVLEESRTTTIAGNKAITAAPAQDGLTIIIFVSVKGNAQTVPNRINNKGWLNLGFLAGAKLKISYKINPYCAPGTFVTPFLQKQLALESWP